VTASKANRQKSISKTLTTNHPTVVSPALYSSLQMNDMPPFPYEKRYQRLGWAGCSTSTAALRSAFNRGIAFWASGTVRHVIMWTSGSGTVEWMDGVKPSISLTLTADINNRTVGGNDDLVWRSLFGGRELLCKLYRRPRSLLKAFSQ